MSSFCYALPIRANGYKGGFKKLKGGTNMLKIIIGILAFVGIVAAVVCSIARTPENLRGFYGGMFWTIAIVAIVGVSIVTIIGIL